MQEKMIIGVLVELKIDPYTTEHHILIIQQTNLVLRGRSVHHTDLCFLQHRHGGNLGVITSAAVRARGQVAARCDGPPRVALRVDVGLVLVVSITNKGGE